MATLKMNETTHKFGFKFNREHMLDNGWIRVKNCFLQLQYEKPTLLRQLEEETLQMLHDIKSG